MPSRTNKTQATKADVAAFLARDEDPARRADCDTLLAMMQRATGAPATLWGPSIVGFGAYHYRYDSGREGDAAVVGFSPRRAELVVYIVPGFEAYQDLLARLGRHRTGKSCLYLRRLADVDLAVLDELVTKSVAAMASKRTA